MIILVLIFPFQKKIIVKLKNKIVFVSTFFSYDNGIIYPIYISSEKFSDNMDLLLIHEENKSHYVCIKDFDRLMFNKSKNKNKKHCCRYCLQRFSSKNILTEHKENCLVINGKQCVKLSEGFISFKNYSRQMPVPFKIYANFEYILKETKVSKCNFIEEIIDKNSSYTKNDQSHIPCGFGYKVICIGNRFNKYIVIYRGKDCINKFISMIVEEYEYCNGVMKNYFKKKINNDCNKSNKVKSNNCKISNKGWICDKLFDTIDEK